MRYDDPKFVMEILDFDNMADHTLAMIMNNTVHEARKKVFRKLTNYQVNRVLNGVPNMTCKIEWSKMKPKFEHLDVKEIGVRSIDNEKVTLSFLRKKYFTPWILSTIIEATPCYTKKKLLLKMSLSNLKKVAHGKINIYDKREYKGAYIARILVEKNTSVVDGKLLMSGVKRKDIMNEGWITFSPGTDLEREYTMKEYCELLLACANQHYRENPDGKYKPEMPLYERTVNDLLSYYIILKNTGYPLYNMSAYDRANYYYLVEMARYKKPYSLEF